MSKKYGSSVGFPYKKNEVPESITGTTYVTPPEVSDPAIAFEIDESPKSEGWKAKRDKKKTEEQPMTE